MKIYTSYYAKMKDYWWEYAIVRVSRSAPAWLPFDVVEFPELYPSWNLVYGIKQGTITWEDYERVYKEKLQAMEREEVLGELQRISEQQGGKDVVLLCYEAPGKNCHRHLIAQWLGNVEELRG